MARTTLKKNTKRSVEPPQEKIDSGTGQLMVAVALSLDILQGIIGILPVVGFILAPLISLFIWLIFWVWLRFHGVSLTKNIKRTVLMWGGFFLELIPILNILPIWTITIFIIVLLVRNQDKRKIKKSIRNTNDAEKREKRYNNIGVPTRHPTIGKRH